MNSLSQLWGSPVMSPWAKLIRTPLRLIPDATVVRVRSGINRGFKWRVGSSTHSCWVGSYEGEKQAVISSMVRPGMTVWDIGANAGFYTLAFSRLVGPAGKVVAIEPDAHNVVNLLAHVRLNRIKNASVIQAAVSDRTGLHAFGGDGEFASLVDSGGYLVSTVTVDGLAKKLGPPDVIKIDAEGAEASVLEGAINVLEQHKPVLFIALHSRAAFRACELVLRCCDYEARDFNQQPATAESHDAVAMPRRK